MTSNQPSSHLPPPAYSDPRAFWADPDLDPAIFGPWDPLHPDTSSPVHLRQQEAIKSVLGVSAQGPQGPQASQSQGQPQPQPQGRPRRQIKSIFEAGCGYGRLARFFKDLLPDATYAGLDVGHQQLVSAKSFRPDGIFYHDDLLSFDVAALYDNTSFEGFDLVVASELLMHIRPGDLQRAYNQLLALANPVHGKVLSIDWVPQPGELEALAAKAKKHPISTSNSASGSGSGVAFWNFAHNYRALFRASGMGLSGDGIKQLRSDQQMLFLVQP